MPFGKNRTGYITPTRMISCRSLQQLTLRGVAEAVEFACQNARVATFTIIASRNNLIDEL
jgi:hypothetical protein